MCLTNIVLTKLLNENIGNYDYVQSNRLHVNSLETDQEGKDKKGQAKNIGRRRHNLKCLL